ncbi:MAG: LicD family protein [Thermoguttaceae bacterium]|nr:LicD family protein [Thermoguttaceae bacterium]
MNDEIIKKIHDVNYKVLRAFDEICKANEIPYFLDSGTLLGAVRHHDFIPWDDDLDVAVFASDFPRLKAVLQEQLPPEYEYVEYTSYNGYFRNFINRVIVKGSQIRKMQPNEPYSKHATLGIDIFVMESAPENAFLRFVKITARRLTFAFALGHYWGLDYRNRPLFRKIVLYILASIGRLIPLKWLFRFHEFLVNYEPINEKELLLGINRTFPFLTCIFRKEWFSQSCNVQIRDLTLPAPIGYDSILKAFYGDYMQLPPEEERKPRCTLDEVTIPE